MLKIARGAPAYAEAYLVRFERVEEA